MSTYTHIILKACIRSHDPHYIPQYYSVDHMTAMYGNSYGNSQGLLWQSLLLHMSHMCHSMICQR